MVVSTAFQNFIDENAAPEIREFARLVLKGDFDLSGSRIIREKGVFSVPSALARRSCFFLQGLASSHFPAGHYTRRSDVASYLMALTFDGEGSLEYEDKRYTLKPGEGFIIDCRKPHYYHARSRSGWGYHIIHFDGFAMADYFSQIRRGGGIWFSVNDGMASLLDELYAVEPLPSRRLELVNSCVITNMLTEIIKTMPGMDAGEAPGKFKDIRDFLDEHYAEELSLQALSDRFFMSKYHLCREFKKHIGRPPNEYLTGVRINNAKALLRFTDKRIADIARETGFGDGSRFFRVFKKYEALSPAEYRGQH